MTAYTSPDGLTEALEHGMHFGPRPNLVVWTGKPRAYQRRGFWHLACGGWTFGCYESVAQMQRALDLWGKR